MEKPKNDSIYKSCRELPIHNFNEIIVTSDLTNLIKDGSAQDEKELAVHWQFILDEYHEISNDKTFIRILKDKAEIIYLQNKAFACEIIIGLFGKELNDEQKSLIDELRKKYRVKNAKTSLSHTKNRLNLKIAQFERMTSHPESKSSFGAMIVRVSRILGYKIDRFTTTVEEWLGAVKMADEIVRESKKRKN